MFDTESCFKTENQGFILNNKIKCGEIWMFKQTWTIQFACEYCGTKLEDLQPFLLHSLQHYLSASEYGIFTKFENLKKFELNGKNTITTVPNKGSRCKKDLRLEETQEADVAMNNSPSDFTYSLTSEEDQLNNVDTNFEFLDTGPEEESDQMKEEISETNGKFQPPISCQINIHDQNSKKQEERDSSNISIEAMETISNEDAEHPAETKIHENKNSCQTDFSCEYCGKLFRKRTTFEDHIKRHLSPKIFNCTMCTRSYVVRSELLRHIRRHTNERKYKCEVCDGSFYEVSGLKAHQKIHQLENSLKNGTANSSKATKAKTTILQRDLNQPITSSTAENVKQEYTCDLCSKTFTLPCKLSIHKQRHALKYVNNNQKTNVSRAPRYKRLREYKCDICSKEFKRQYELTIHKRRHDKTHCLTCEFCGASFPENRSFSIHRMRHLGIKKHKCSLCDKSFVTSTELQLHTRSHTGERPYECKDCGQMFTTASGRMAHRKHFHKVS